MNRIHLSIYLVRRLFVPILYPSELCCVLGTDFSRRFQCILGAAAVVDILTPSSLLSFIDHEDGSQPIDVQFQSLKNVILLK